MSNLVSGITKIFNPGESFLSTEAKVAGVVIATALIAYSIYLRSSSAVTRPVPAPEDSVVVRDGSRTFEYISTPTKLLLEYRGGRPDQANEEIKQSMAKAIKTFLDKNHQPISHQLPDTSKLDIVEHSSGTHGSCQTGSWETKIIHQIDKSSQLYKLEISVLGRLGDSYWEPIVNALLDWRKGFSLTENYYG